MLATIDLFDCLQLAVGAVLGTLAGVRWRPVGRAPAALLTANILLCGAAGAAAALGMRWPELPWLVVAGAAAAALPVSAAVSTGSRSARQLRRSVLLAAAHIWGGVAAALVGAGGTLLVVLALTATT